MARTRIDILDEYGPCARAVGLPHLKTSRAIIGAEVQRPVDVREPVQVSSAGARKDIANQFRQCRQHGAIFEHVDE